MRRGLAVFALQGLFACAEVATAKSPVSQPVRTGWFSPDIDSLRSQWYGGALRAMKETSLWETSNDGSREVYRFTWLRTWGRPVTIRFDVTASGTTMRVVQLDGHGGYNPGKIAMDRKRTLTSAEWSAVATGLQRTAFWSTATTEYVLGNDGLQWIIEGVRAGDYHVVDRWTPSDHTDRRELGPFLDACRRAFAVAALTDRFE
jgi:hypothetical protein